MTFSAKMNFFRTVVTKAACKELQKYVAVLNHSQEEKKKKKDEIPCQHSFAHERKQLMPYRTNEIKHFISADKFLRLLSVFPRNEHL